MIVTVKKGMNKKQINDELKKIEKSKRFISKRHLGKVKWNEDPLIFQKKLRDEWN